MKYAILLAGVCLALGSVEIIGNIIGLFFIGIGLLLIDTGSMVDTTTQQE